MIIRKYTPYEINLPIDQPPTLYFDIETTGLNRQKHPIILIAAGFFKDKTVEIRQYCAENTGQEKEILSAFVKDIRSVEHLVSFNGKVFDAPFLDTAFARHHIPFQISSKSHEDLLVFLRPLKKIWLFDNLKLKSVEQFFGIRRKDTISGKDSIDLYRAYLRHPNPAYLHNILLHNYEDVKHLSILHQKVWERITEESICIPLGEKSFQTFLYNFSHQHHTADFHFKNIHSDLSLHYFYENGDQLKIEGSHTLLQTILKKGRDSSGQTVYYTSFSEYKIPLIRDRQLLIDNLYSLLKYKISEIFA